MSRILARALWIAGLTVPILAPGSAIAGPPDLDVVELAAGEFSGEVNIFLGSDAWIVRPALEFGLGDTVGLEMQAEVVDAPGGAAALSNISAQVMAAFTADGSFGVAVEIGYNPDERNTGGEVFLFASRSLGPWAVAVNAGLEREEGATATVYAWHIERAFGSGWSAGMEGGGEIPLHDGERAHVLGPTLGLRFASLELSVSWLFGRNTNNLARIGLERAF